MRRLVAARFPEWSGLSVEEVAGDGTVNRIFRVGDAGTIRIPLQVGDDTAERMREEADAAEEFRAVATVPAPRPLGRGDHEFGRPWSAQSWLPGVVATPRSMESSDAFADDLATLILALRLAPTRGRTFAGSGRGGRLPDHDAWVERCLAESRGLLDTERIRELWERLRVLPRSAREAMSHGDLTPPNLLTASGRLVGVLDTGGFGPADPALDLVSAWHLLDRSRRQRMRRALGSDEGEWRRGAAWALEQAIGLVWYYRETLPGMSELGRVTLGRLLADPDL